MNLLQLFFIVSGFILVLIGYDFLKKRRLTIFQIFILMLAGVALVVFTVYPPSLHYFGKLFGVSRGAYVLIYLSIIFLTYMLINVLNKVEENRQTNTKIIREMAFLEFKFRNENK